MGSSTVGVGKKELPTVLPKTDIFGKANDPLLKSQQE
jgi:hypothetical protein